MKKIYCYAIVILLIITLTSLIITSCGSDSDSNGESTETTGDINTFITKLENDGFTVQEGEYSLVNAIQLCIDGEATNCNGNNAGNPYFAYELPEAPGQTMPNMIQGLAYPLRSDEAIVFVGRTPPKMKYFSYRSFLLSRYNQETQEYKKIYASLGDCTNLYNISTEGTPEGADGDSYNQLAIIVTTADRGIDNRVRTAAKSAGYPEVIMNTDVIPSSLVNMGLDKGCDIFTFLGRTAMFLDEEACQAYIENPDVRVFRLTPNTQSELDPFPTQELQPRGTGTNEMDFMPAVEELRSAILAKYSNYKATELQTDIWLPEAYESIQSGEDCIGESRDTSYLRTNVASQFKLSDNPDDFLVVYGVNHVQTGKCIYANFILYGAEYFNGVASIDDSKYPGSVEDYLPGHSQTQYLYAWKVARNANGDPYCLEVPTGPSLYGIGLEDDAYVGFRSYIEKETEVGPAYNEIIYDRVIHFTPK